MKFGCQFLHNDSGFIQVEGNYVAVNQNPIAFGVHSSHIEVLGTKTKVIRVMNM